MKVETRCMAWVTAGAFEIATRKLPEGAQIRCWRPLQSEAERACGFCHIHREREQKGKPRENAPARP